ncbi:energy transducer TonB [Rheinheimera sp.]|uniref:energy transducer TonB n=1 Tax=Rheinheimera sp. TaxID=1869214 RepID=UPI00307FAF31
MLNLTSFSKLADAGNCSCRVRRSVLLWCCSGKPSWLARFDINPYGTVSTIQITKSVPEATFDQVSLTTLAQWRYQATATGVKGATVQLDYRLDEAPETEMERVQVKPAGASHSDCGSELYLKRYHQPGRSLCSVQHSGKLMCNC